MRLEDMPPVLECTLTIVLPALLAFAGGAVLIIATARAMLGVN